MEGIDPDKNEYEIKDRWDRELGDKHSYLIKNDAQSAEYVDHLKSGFETWKLLVEEEPGLASFHKIVRINQWGVMEVDHEEARKLFNAYWNKFRLTYNSSEIDYERMIPVDGRMVPMREHMLGENIRKTQEKIQKYYLEMAGKGGEDKKTYERMAKDIMKKPALAAMMNMVTAGIHEHMEFGSSHGMWSVQHVQKIQQVMELFLHEKGAIELGGESGNEHIHQKTPQMMPYELFNRLLGVRKSHSWLFGETEDSMDGYQFWEILSGFSLAILEGLAGLKFEMEDELKGQPVKTWLGTG
jgi:hypothetical protein